MNLYWKSLFGGLMSTAKYEDKLQKEAVDYNRYLLISESKELEEYNELYQQVKSSSFKELKRTLVSRKYKDTQEYRDMSKYEKLEKNKNFNGYRKPDYFFNRLTIEEKNKIIKENPA